VLKETKKPGKAFEAVGGKVTEQVTHHVTHQVTHQVLSLLQSLAGEVTRAEIMATLGLKDRMHFSREYLQAALDAGLIEMTIPDKPRSSKQKYRLTEAGKQILDQDR
jgi:ATP-dependent DNA helicase RecG